MGSWLCWMIIVPQMSTFRTSTFVAIYDVRFGTLWSTLAKAISHKCASFDTVKLFWRCLQNHASCKDKKNKLKMKFWWKFSTFLMRSTRNSMLMKTSSLFFKNWLNICSNSAIYMNFLIKHLCHKKYFMAPFQKFDYLSCC